MEGLFADMLSALVFILPLYIVNATMVIIWHISGYKSARPLHRQWFGERRDWKGIAVFLIATPILYSLFGYSAFMGLVLGAGGYLGTLGNCFIKRRLKMPSGTPFPVFDQLDFVVGAFIAYFLAFGSLPANAIIILPMTLVLHPAGNIIAYKLGLKKVWW
ncbi:MAG: CDP-archaeol synthase [Candidatus Micrarchaeota archaeon]